MDEKQVDSIGTKIIQLLFAFVSLAFLILGGLFLSNSDAQSEMVTYIAACLTLISLAGIVGVVIFYFKGTKANA
ncbi:MAG: hypothetical protein ABJH06_15400 [Paraglaciecola sp.]|uniref:hypothetical protein n=1 Tax=Paraglaciecola sp. TaxID=1920173 RepID=UPI003299CCC9